MVKLTESIIVSRTKVSELDMVRKLNCWGCELDDIEILQQMPNIEILSLSVNNITSLWPLAGCTNLRELYLRKNNITELNEFRHLRRLTKLRILWLSENPCSDHPDYRYHILRVLPSLTTLDNRAVTEEELGAVTAYFQSNSASADETFSAHYDEPNSHSSPECDVVVSEYSNVISGVGYRTVRLPDGQFSNGTRSTERPIKGIENIAMSTSCYVPNSVAQCNGFNNTRNDHRNMSTSVSSLYETTPERNNHYETISWQQRRQSSASRNSVYKAQNNVLTAVIMLLDELDKQGLETLISEAELRLRRM